MRKRLIWNDCRQNRPERRPGTEHRRVAESNGLVSTIILRELQWMGSRARAGSSAVKEKSSRVSPAALIDLSDQFMGIPSAR